MEGFEYAAAIKDEMSKPAVQAKQALVHLKDQLKATEASIKALKDAQVRFKAAGLKDEVKASSDAIAKMKEKMSDLKDQTKSTEAGIKEMAKAEKEEAQAAKEAGEETKSWIAGGLALAAAIFYKIGEAAKWAAERLAEWTVETAKVAIEAGAAKERLVAMYDYFGGGKGQEIFQKLDALGTAIHVPTEKVHEYAKDLIQSGIEGQNRIEQTVKSVAMLQKVAGDDAANKIKGLIEESAKTKKTQFWKGGQGTFTVTREQLVGTGVTVDQVYEALAKRTKMGVAQVKQQMMMGRISADQGIDALNDVLERGKVGDTAREMVGDLGQAITEISDNFKKLLKDVDYKGFIKEMQGFARLFDPMTASGKVAKTVMTDVFNTIFKVAKDTVHFLRLRILDLEIAGLELLIFLGPQIKQFKKLFAEVKNSALAAMLATVAWSELKGMFVAAAFSLKGLIMFVEGGMVAFNALSDAITKVTDVGKSIAQALDMKKLGSDLIRDLIEGIKTQMGAVKQAASDVGGSLKEGFKDAIGWHSPPKFFLDAGKESHGAFAKGYGDDAQGGGAFAKQAPQLQASGGRAITVDIGGVTVEITGVKGAEEAVDMFRARLTDELEKIADALGGKLVGT